MAQDIYAPQGTDTGDWFTQNAPGGAFSGGTFNGGVTGYGAPGTPPPVIQGPGAASGPYGGDPTDVDSWLDWMASQPGHDPILETQQGKDYYKQAILSKPDKLNANNLAYWQNKATLAANGGAVGAPEGGSGGGQGGFGSGWATLPTADQYLNSPGAQAALKRGQQSIQTTALNRGTGLSGGVLKDLSDFTVNNVLTGYNNYAGLNLNYLGENNKNLYNWANLGMNASSVGPNKPA